MIYFRQRQALEWKKIHSGLVGVCPDRHDDDARSKVFEAEFSGVTFDAVIVTDLEQARVRLIEDVRSRLIGNAARFLRTLVDGEPDFVAIGLPSAAELPAVQRKLHSIQKLRDTNVTKHAGQCENLEFLLDRYSTRPSD